MTSFLFKRGFILPVMVTGVIPLAVVGAKRASVSMALFPSLVGGAIFLCGLGMLIWTTGLFARHHGSLAPWNPPPQLVIVGPYRHCRNPMISGVYAMLVGEAIAFQLPWLAAWCTAFIIGMSSNIVFHEEPVLLKRFGEAYAQYCKSVPRWIPRIRPYNAGQPIRSAD